MYFEKPYYLQPVWKNSKGYACCGRLCRHRLGIAMGWRSSARASGWVRWWRAARC